jgi:hypothetical protein
VKRDVAVTMVPDAFAHDPEPLVPFERERPGAQSRAARDTRFTLALRRARLAL